MAEQFVGYTVLVTLKSPPNCQIQGVVADVVGQRLTLRDVTLLWNNQNLPLYHIEAPGIADLELLSHQRSASASAPELSYNRQPAGNFHSPSPLPLQYQSQLALPISANPPTPQAQSSQQPFVDPAILSYQKPPKAQQDAISTVQPPSKTPTAASPVMIGGHELPAPSRATETVSSTTAPESVATAATLTTPFSDLSLKGDKVEENKKVAQDTTAQDTVPEGRRGAGPLEAPLKYTGKRSRRGGRGKLQRDAAMEASGAEINDMPTKTMESSPASKGWRRTAFVEPAQEINSRSPRPTTRRQPKRRQKHHAEEQNGWATEDATDIQEMGEFDFQSNLSKFDKRQVFDQIRNDDTTADEERLVSFNRRTRPGTNGGRNLHYTENVLDAPPEPKAKWTSEIVETDEDDASGKDFSNGRTSSRARSRASVQAPSSRKSSGIPNPTVASPSISILARGQLLSTRTASPRPPQKQVLHAASPMTGSSGSAPGSLQVTATNRRCPTVSPLQMLEIEQLSISELGLTEDIITENAGRGIAEAAISLSNLHVSSTILIFAGNHRTGARAVSAARHLRNHSYRVTVCILGLDREDEFAEGLRKQVDIFKKAGGKVLRWEEMSPKLSAVDYAPELVMDALFGMHVAFEDLRTDDQQTAFEIVSWVNRSGIDVLSVDIPSGLSASSGEPTLVQGSRLAANSKFIVCLGAPKSGLVNALAAGEGDSWQIAVADVGISQAAWRKYGTRRRHGVDFGDKWVVPLSFQAVAASV
ncbi:enhancer of mRNA decapping [Emydomyces testavorans]|uniref:Enhancer of mRNA-decapping protein 3 n=1 Tax=Emydomyces testavorans TaxID=2070801 RepID=A0AAF0DMT0_9EURO|nr:enhancer of mRNA decapping [Emydomyces testavorans]